MSRGVTVAFPQTYFNLSESFVNTYCPTLDDGLLRYVSHYTCVNEPSKKTLVLPLHLNCLLRTVSHQETPEQKVAVWKVLWGRIVTDGVESF